MSLTIRSAILAFALPALAGVGSASAQVVLRGVVVERSDAVPIPQATVRLGDDRAGTTDANGRFLLTDVDPGRHTLEVQALGYASRRIDIVLARDTSLVIELEVDAVRIDRLEARSVTISGTLHDAETGGRLAGGQVNIQPGGEIGAANGGRFRIRGVQAGRMRVVARAIEYLPTVIELDAQGDTTLRIDMVVDSVAIKMIGQQVDRLAQRAEAEPYSVRELDRDDIRRTGSPTVGDLIRRQMLGSGVRGPVTLNRGLGPSAGLRPTQPAACVTFDDRPVDPDALRSIPAELIERVEIFGFRGNMIRVYSKHYVASLMARSQLPKIHFVTTGLGSVCM